MLVTANESFKALTMSELQIEHTAVGFHQSEGVQFALIAGIIQRAEVPPIDFKTLTGRGLHANEGATRLGFGANLFQIVAQDRVAAAVA